MKCAAQQLRLSGSTESQCPIRPRGTALAAAGSAKWSAMAVWAAVRAASEQMNSKTPVARRRNNSSARSASCTRSQHSSHVVLKVPAEGDIHVVLTTALVMVEKHSRTAVRVLKKALVTADYSARRVIGWAMRDAHRQTPSLGPCAAHHPLRALLLIRHAQESLASRLRAHEMTRHCLGTSAMCRCAAEGAAAGAPHRRACC